MRPTLLALIVAAASCGSPHHGQTVTVTIHGMKFEPEALTVDRGDTVVFDNQDIVAHTATGQGLFDSGPIQPKQTWRITLPRPGDYPYRCTLHVGMNGKITVR